MMRNQPTTTRTGVVLVARQPIARDQRGLLHALAVIDVEGWDGETATSLLTYIRHELVRPLTIDIGLRGGAASEAEQTARRAVLGEILAARWGTDWRRAWEHDAEERAGRSVRPISLEPLLRDGVEPAPLHSTPACTPPTRVSAALDLAAAALADSGWSTATAKEIVAEVAAMEEALSYGATVVGWRPLAARLGLPPW